MGLMGSGKSLQDILVDWRSLKSGSTVDKPDREGFQCPLQGFDRFAVKKGLGLNGIQVEISGQIVGKSEYCFPDHLLGVIEDFIDSACHWRFLDVNGSIAFFFTLAWTILYRSQEPNARRFFFGVKLSKIGATCYDAQIGNFGQDPLFSGLDGR